MSNIKTKRKNKNNDDETVQKSIKYFFNTVFRVRN